MRIQTDVKAGGVSRRPNHNETIVRARKGVAVKTRLKAGGVWGNRNETLVRAPKRVVVKTNVKAGGTEYQHNETLVRGASPRARR